MQVLPVDVVRGRREPDGPGVRLEEVGHGALGSGAAEAPGEEAGEPRGEPGGRLVVRGHHPRPVGRGKRHEGYPDALRLDPGLLPLHLRPANTYPPIYNAL